MRSVRKAPPNKQLADAARPEELFTGQWQNRPSILDEYKTYLDDRWNEGFTNAWKLWEEIVPLGYKGSYQRVCAYLHEKRASPRPVAAQPPSPRTVAGWILSRPETLTEPEQLQLKTVRAHCPELDALTRHVRSFAVMLTERQGERQPHWLDAVRKDERPAQPPHPRRRHRPRPRRRHRRTHPALELRRRRRTRESHQDAQTPDVRPRRIPSPTKERPALHMTPRATLAHRRYSLRL